MRTVLLAILVSLALTSCDSTLDSPPIFDALEGTWSAQVQATPDAIRFLPSGRYDFIADGQVTEQGRFSLASDGEAADIDALSALRDIQFYADSDGSGPTFFRVVSATTTELSLQRCATDCEGVPIQVYRR